MVERGPEKAGVGGSIPSLGTFSFLRLKCFALYSKGGILPHFCTFPCCEPCPSFRERGNTSKFRLHIDGY